MDQTQFGQLMHEVGEIKTEQQNLRRELLGNGQPGRIQMLENRVDSHQKKQWAHSVIIVPLNFVLHAIAAHFGFKG